MRRLLAWFTPTDWKRGIALVILWAYAYQLVVWPPFFWVTTLITSLTALQIPGPPIVPWECLAAGTTTLAAIGGLEKWGDRSPEKTA